MNIFVKIHSIIEKLFNFRSDSDCSGNSFLFKYTNQKELERKARSDLETNKKKFLFNEIFSKSESPKKIILFIFLLIYNCSIPNMNPKKISQTNSNVLSLIALYEATKNGCKNEDGFFWVRNILSSSQASYCIQANLVASSSTVKIYLEKNLTTDLDYSSVANAFDLILTKETSAIGPPSDINSDSKVTVLILNIIDGATAQTGFIAGYVDPVNFFEDNPAFSSRSNQREILFMDGVELIALRKKDLAANKPDPFLSTLAHELQHLIRFPHSNGQDQTWIDEGTSEVISDITGYGPQTSRINCFKGDSSSSTSCNGGIGSTSTNSPSLFTWRGNLKNYAYSYSFMKYIYESSGIDETTRNQFFKNTVLGQNSVRGNNIQNLTQLFMSSSGFNSTVLSNTNKTVFQRLFASFLGQASGYQNLSTSYFGNQTSINIDNVRTTYPFSTSLNLLSTPNPFGAISVSSSGMYSLIPSQVNRVTGTTTGITNNQSNFIAIQGTGSFLIINGENSENSTTSSVSAIISDSNANEVICPHDFLLKDLNVKLETKKMRKFRFE